MPPADWTELFAEPLPTDRAIAALSDNGAGGIAVFLGTTRNDTDPAGRPLVALDYEAYGEMAANQLRDLAVRARQQWPIMRLVLLHRIGRVPLAEASVLVGVSTPHRGEAFDACRWLIDTLKAEVTIWKREVWADGFVGATPDFGELSRVVSPGPDFACSPESPDGDPSP